MQSGSLRTRIQIQAETVIRNNYGEQIVSFNTIHSVMAKTKTTNGLKSVNGDSIVAENKTTFYIRYIPNLSSKMRILVPQKFAGVEYPSLVYRIESISNDDKKRESIILAKIFE